VLDNKGFNKLSVIFLVLLGTIASFTLVANAGTLIAAGALNREQTEKVGELGWIHWDKGLVKAVGAAADKETAIAKAYTNLSEIIEEINVNPQTRVKDLLFANENLRQRVDAFVKQAPLANEKKQTDGTYRVVVTANLYGDHGLLNLFYSNQANPVSQTPGYSGLVIDATGLALERCPVLKIYDATGKEIYGTVKTASTYSAEQGLVGYAFDPQTIQLIDSGKSRAGANPLLIKAVGVKDHNVNIIISQADGETILAANKATGFLEKFAVVIKKTN